MIPAATTALPVAKAVQTPAPQAAQTKPDAALQGQARSSAGEAAAAKVRAETTKAVDPSRQSATAPRLRDQETAERSNRTTQPRDTPTGPPPAFKETPMERAARIAFDPPEIGIPTPIKEPNAVVNKDEPPKPEAVSDADQPEAVAAKRAEDGFAEAKDLSEPKEPPQIDLAL